MLINPQIFDDPEFKKLLSSEILVLMYLMARANKNNECWPSIRKIAGDIHLKYKTIIKALKQLKLNNFIKIDKASGLSSHYTIGVVNGPTPKEIGVVNGPTPCGKWANGTVVNGPTVGVVNGPTKQITSLTDQLTNHLNTTTTEVAVDGPRSKSKSKNKTIKSKNRGCCLDCGDVNLTERSLGLNCIDCNDSEDRYPGLDKFMEIWPDEVEWDKIRTSWSVGTDCVDQLLAATEVYKKNRNNARYNYSTWLGGAWKKWIPRNGHKSEKTKKRIVDPEKDIIADRDAKIVYYN